MKITDCKIIAVRGKSSYLLEIPNSKKGIVLDLFNNNISKPFNMASIVARGYWEEYKGEQSELPKLLKKLKK